MAVLGDNPSPGPFPKSGRGEKEVFLLSFAPKNGRKTLLAGKTILSRNQGFRLLLFTSKFIDD
jgi:hypothetical protein